MYVLERGKGPGEISSINQSLTNIAVSRTAPATPGLQNRYKYNIINRPGVDGAVLQTASSLINKALSDSAEDDRS